MFRRPAGGATLHAGDFELPLDDGEFGDQSTAVMPPGATFLALTSPGHGNPAGQPEHGAAMVVGALATGGAALAAAAAGLRAAGRRRAVLLAVAAGLADACSAVVTMAFSHVAGQGLAAVFERA